jgi:Trk-type K+ transport system membrane component
MSIKEDIEKVQKKVNVIEEQSFAMEILKDYKKANKRMFIIIIIILVMWFATIGYLVYILNDISNVETTTTQEVSDINTVGGNITNGGE